MKNQTVESVKRIGTGLAFIVFPLVFLFAFASHPNLFSLAIVTDVNERIADFHGNQLIHFGHAMMLLTVPLLIVVALKLMHMPEESRPWLGFIGGAMAVFGAVMLAVDKAALCLVPSAFDTLSEAQFAQLQPGIEAMYNFEGWLVLLYLLPLLPFGFMLQGIGLYYGRVVPRWQSICLIAGSVLLFVSAAVDIDLFGVVASVILAIGLIPFGFQLMSRSGGAAQAMQQAAQPA